MTEQRLPRQYRPFQRIAFCSNTLIGRWIPFRIGAVVPLLIGNGRAPVIWLTAKDGTPLVENNVAWTKSVDLQIRQDRTTAAIGAVILVDARKLPDGTAEVTEVDLRPLGLKIHGDAAGLVVGTNQLVDNFFEGTGVMVGIGSV